MEQVDQRRRWLMPAAIIGAGIAAVAVAAGGLALVNGADSTPAARPSCDVPTSPPPGTVAPADSAPDGGGLRVIEKGFTQVDKDRVRPEGWKVSLGAIVENTSKHVAYRTRVSFQVLDAQNKSAVYPRSRILIQEIPVILPGQRIGVGAGTYVREKPKYKSITVAGLEIDLGSTHWVSEKTGIFAEISTRHLRTDRDAQPRDTGTVYYEVNSTYCRKLAPRGVATVFRNSAGTVVGGSFETSVALSRCEPGKSEELLLSIDSIPPNIDDSKTASYVYCDLARPNIGQPEPSDAPVN